MSPIFLAGEDEGEGRPNFVLFIPPFPSPIEGGGYGEANFKYACLVLIAGKGLWVTSEKGIDDLRGALHDFCGEG